MDQRISCQPVTSRTRGIVSLCKKFRRTDCRYPNMFYVAAFDQRQKVCRSDFGRYFVCGLVKPVRMTVLFVAVSGLEN